MRTPIPTVCVGSVLAGGSGKTPVAQAVVEVVRALTAGAIEPHVVCRGYGGRAVGPTRVALDVHDALCVGDEPLLHAAAGAPTWVARDRLAGVAAAAAHGARLAVLDDGLQHWRLRADVALLVLRTPRTRALGNARTLPAGPLREPVGRALARVDAIVILDDQSCGAIVEARQPAVACTVAPCAAAYLESSSSIAPSADALELARELVDLRARERSQPLVLHAALCPTAASRAALVGLDVVAFSASASPEPFDATLHALVSERARAGARAGRIFAHYAYPDHTHLDEAEVTWLLARARDARARLVCTAKDAVRLPVWARAHVLVLSVRVVWEGASAARLSALLAERALGGSAQAAVHTTTAR